MLIYVKKKEKKRKFFIGRTDGRTDTRSTQNYSSEPHKTSQKTYIGNSKKKVKNT